MFIIAIWRMKFYNITMFLWFCAAVANGPPGMVIRSVEICSQNLVAAARWSVCKCKQASFSVIPLYGCSSKLCFGKIIFGEKGSSFWFPSKIPFDMWLCPQSFLLLRVHFACCHVCLPTMISFLLVSRLHLFCTFITWSLYLDLGLLAG
jgi:hypothetical protein